MPASKSPFEYQRIKLKLGGWGLIKSSNICGKKTKNPTLFVQVKTKQKVQDVPAPARVCQKAITPTERINTPLVSVESLVVICW